METTTTDILILGSGGAGLFAALHAYDANPRASILITVKGLLGKSGCTRMVQGGYNAVLHPQDSLAQHFQDTIEGARTSMTRNSPGRSCKQPHSAFANWKHVWAASLIVILTAPSIKKPLPGNRMIAPYTEGISPVSRS